MRRALLVAWLAIAWVLGAMLALSTRLVLLTLRMKSARMPEGPVVLACWHRHLPLTIPLAGRRRCWTMMSPAPYMAPIAAWARLLGVRLVRGTSGVGGHQALEVLAAKVRAGDSVLLAVDGPHGPAFVAKSGCARLASETDVPLLAFGFRARRGVELPTWDRQFWPLPFTGVDIVVEPVDAHETAEMLKAAQRALNPLAPPSSSG